MQIISTAYNNIFNNNYKFGTNNQAVVYKNLGNDFVNNNDYKSAIESYKKSISLDNTYADAYYNLAKAYYHTEKFEQAKITYENLVKLIPDNVEYRANLASCYLKTGDIKNARIQVEKALLLDKNYDPVHRILKEIELENMRRFSDKLAQTKIYAQEKENIANALKLVKTYYPKEVIDKVADVRVMFDTTEKMQGYSNIAQYENYNNRIVISNEYLWAAPEVVAAYLVHEIIHASDRDAYTSIKEEQDAYEESVKYWGKFNNGVKDPELDYAYDLYKQEPSLLAQRVRQIYKSRDNQIAEFSPNHGIEPWGLKFWLQKIKDFLFEIFLIPSKSKKLAVIA